MAIAEYLVTLDPPVYPSLPAHVGAAYERYQLDIYPQNPARQGEFIILEDRPSFTNNAYELIRDINYGGAVIAADTPVRPYFHYLGLQAHKAGASYGTRLSMHIPSVQQLTTRALPFPTPRGQQLVMPKPFSGGIFPARLFFETLVRENSLLVSTDQERRHDILVHFPVWSMVPAVALSKLKREAAASIAEHDHDTLSELMGNVDFVIAAETLGAAVVQAFKDEMAAEARTPKEARKHWLSVAETWDELFDGDNMPIAMAQRHHCRAIGQAAIQYMALPQGST